MFNHRPVKSRCRTVTVQLLQRNQFHPHPQSIQTLVFCRFTANINAIFFSVLLIFFFIKQTVKQNFCFTKKNYFINMTNSANILTSNKLSREVSTYYSLSVCATDYPGAGHEGTASKCFQSSCCFTLRSDVKGKRRLSTQIPLKTWTELLIWVSNSYWLGADDRTLKPLKILSAMLLKFLCHEKKWP